MNIVQRLAEIKSLQAIDVPWEVSRIFGKINIFGDNICVDADGNNDYVSLEEFQGALEWLVGNCGGKVAWDKLPKKSKAANKEQKK